MSSIRPMLAAKFDDPNNIEPELAKLSYPLLGSPKVDGIRFLKVPTMGAMSRSGKLLPNRMLQSLVQGELFNFLDGEVIVGSNPKVPGLFNRTQSAIMTADDIQPLSLWIFDHWQEVGDPFSRRTTRAHAWVGELQSRGSLYVNYLEQARLNNLEEVLQYEQEAIEVGYEGIMLRHPEAPYKFGRSTLKQQGLIKVKRFEDAEARVVGFEPLERNTNPQTRDSFGLAKRSSHKAGKVADELLGRLIVHAEPWGEFAIGSGFDVDTRTTIWARRSEYLGKSITFKFQRHGTKDKPRIPIFKGFRPEVD